MPHVNFDLNLKNKFQKKFIIGVDEAGRGPLAGPVVAAACIINNYSNQIIKDVTDSKKLSPIQREDLFRKLLSNECVFFSFAYSTHTEIDKYNILNATLLAMKRAVDRLTRYLSLMIDDVLVVVDGNKTIKDILFKQIAVVKGDEKSAAVGCASIFAKTLRDRWMMYYDKIYPVYDFKKHKGYPTAYHMKLIEKHGLSPIHRQSFAPCKISKV